MPQECKDIKQFIQLLVPKKGQSEEPKRVVKILEKKQANKIITKFKVKTKTGGLYTLVIGDRDKALKLEKALPNSVVAQHIGRLRNSKGKGAKKAH